MQVEEQDIIWKYKNHCSVQKCVNWGHNADVVLLCIYYIYFSPFCQCAAHSNNLISQQSCEVGLAARQ